MGTLLYDGATGFISASPGLSGLGIPGVRQLAYGQLPPLPQSNSVGTPTLNTNLGAGNTGYAGYTNYDPLSAQSTFSLINPASFPTLNRTTGFTVSFNVAVTAETSNPNRAGFSVTVMSSDGAGIELGFKEEGANDRIFAQSADFIESEFITTNINAASTYVLTILDNSYTLSNGTQTLTGSLRNYNFNPLTSTPLYLLIPIYRQTSSFLVTTLTKETPLLRWVRFLPMPFLLPTLTITPLMKMFLLTSLLLVF
jgi:hypothetical protein